MKITKILCDVKVAKLRQVLENRNLKMTGKKAELTERLKQAIQSEGLDPETFQFSDNASAIIFSISSSVKNCVY